jgi:aminoglycoside 6-adenylyltransferase
MDELELRFGEWALGRPDIEAVVVVGSRARTDHPADEWADLDLGILTTQPGSYAHDASWANAIGDVWIAYHDPVGTTWHVMFAGGLDAGVAPLSASVLRPARLLLGTLRLVPAIRRVLPRALRRRLEDAEREIAAYCGRGVRILVDKRGRVARLLRMLPDPAPREGPPSRAEFDAVVAEFWFSAVWAAKHLRRGEVWYAKQHGVDGRMKALLLRMIELHALAADAAVDTWENGRFLEEWADAAALRELSNCFARYAVDDLWTALFATMTLFRRLARATAERLGCEYAVEADDRVTAWVTRCHAETQP